MSKKREELLRELEEESRRSTLDGIFLFQAVAERSGMNLTDLQCLAILAQAGGPVTAGQLAETMRLTTGAVTGVVNRVEGAGYVRREKDPADGRRVVIRLVPEELERAGADLFGSGEGALLEELVSEYDDRDLALLLGFMRKASAVTREQIALIRTASRGDEGDESSPPLGAVEAGQLVFNGAYQLVLRAASGMDELYRARFEGTAPKVTADGGTVTFRYQRRWLPQRWGEAEVTMNAAIPWRVDIRGGASDVRADLDSLDLLGLEVRGGASQIELNLPGPSGTVPVRISGGASSVTVRRPPGVEARVRLKGWAAHLTFDDQTFDVMGKDGVLQSPGYDDAGERYDVEVSGSASNFTLTTSDH